MKNWKQFQRIKFLVYILCLIGASIFLARFSHHKTRGFAMSKIAHNFSSGSHPSSSGIPPLSLLNQSFRFLGRGFQSFVFISDDEEYVLKLFSNRYQRQIQLFSFLSRTPLLTQWAVKKLLNVRSKLDASFISYQLAWDEMPDQTALVYMHLSPSSDLPHTLTLIDPLHISHTIDPNNYAFLVQKKVDLAYPALQHWIHTNQIQKAQSALSSLIELFIRKWRQAIADHDPLIRTNYGFLGTEAIQIDTGPLSKQEKPDPPEVFKKELQRVTTSLKNWLTQNAPDLVSYLDQELEERLSSKDDQALP